MSLEKSLQDTGFAFTPILDGTIHRFDRNGKTGNAWFIGNQYFSSWGDWVTGEKHSEESALALEPGAKEKIEELKANLLQEKKSRQLEAAENARYIWESNKNCFSHPYLTKKKVKAYGLKVSMSGDLIIPIYDSKGELCSLQFISSDGSKRFLPGGKLSGSYYMIGDQESSTVYLCEGYATGASILESLIVEGIGPNACVYIAFNANNLPKVAESLKHWAKEVIICADNDSLTPGNPGVTKAEEALAVLFGGCEANIKVPAFTAQEAESKNTDFNDLHNLHGLEAVKSTLAGVRAPNTPPPSSSLPTTHSIDIHNFSALPRITQLGGKDKTTPVRPSQEALARALSDYFGDSILRQENDLFLWSGTHWVHNLGLPTNKDMLHRLRRMIQYISKGMCDDRYLNGSVNMFMSMCPCANKNLFAPNPFATPFSDGTVWVNPNKFEVEFISSHKKEEYLTRVLPYEWQNSTPPSKILLEYLDKVFDGDPDKEGKIKSLQQMAGACLLPCYPHLFFLTGKAGSGKSTIAKLCGLLVTADYLSRVQPATMKDSFGMQPMINKLVNIHTELSVNLMDDSVMKLIEDREPVYVNRKGIQAVYAAIPALHIFCCNTMPRSLDGGQGAYDRRVTLIEFNTQLKEVTKGEYQRDYEQVIFNADRAGVIAWAKQGLIDLVKSKGIYSVPDTSKQATKKWKEESDIVMQFLGAIEAGEIGESGSELMRSDASIIQGKILLEKYREFCRENKIYYQISRNKFYDRMRQLGFVDFLNQDKIMFFHGFGVRGQDTSKVKESKF